MATCTSFLDGARCIRDADHKGLHQVGWEGTLPEDVTQIVATVMAEADAAEARADRMYRMYRKSYWFMLVAGAVNVTVGLWNLAGVLAG